MRTFSRSQSRRSRLHIETLEGREVPAGVVTATFAGGVLTLVGDDASNFVEIKVEAGVTTLTPNVDTDVGAGVGVANPITGAVTSLKAKMAGGHDNISIDAGAGFALPGGADIDLGDGSSTLSLNTAGKIDLGSLTVKGTDGFTTISVVGGAGMSSQITGNVKLDLGQGGSDTNFSDIALLGSAGVTLTATDGSDILSFTNVTGGKPVKATLGNGQGELNFTNTVVGAVTGSAEDIRAILSSTATATNVGAIKLDGLINADLRSTGAAATTLINGKTSLTTKLPDSNLDLDLQDTNVTGDISTTTKGGSSYTYGELSNVDVTGSITDKQSGANSDSYFKVRDTSKIFGNFTMQSTGVSTDINAEISDSDVLGAIKIASTGSGDTDVDLGLYGVVNTTSITIQGNDSADLDTEVGSNVILTGDVKATSKRSTTAETRGTFKAKNVAITGPVDANFLTEGVSTITGKVTLTGKEEAELRLESGGSLDVTGDVKIDGKIFADLSSQGAFHIAGKVTMKGSEVDIFVTDGTFTVDGDFSAAASYSSEIEFAPSSPSTIKGNASFTSGLNSDKFESFLNMKFEKDLFIDLKDGFNEVGLFGVAGTQTVAGKLTINTGSGNDQVFLGDFSVTGIANLMSGAGADNLGIFAGTTFLDALTIDQGDGDDTLSVASGGPVVTFTGKVTAKQGSGNDVLDMDLAGAFPPVFSGGGHEFDGGIGLDDNGANPNAPPPVGGVKFQNYEV